ncbi:MAG: hypothetical protein Q9211_005897 [Gyalolechia sp. 1 TL-2023]
MPARPRPGNRAFVINGPTYSDGDASHRPGKPNYTQANVDAYLQKVATKWIEDEAGGVEPGTTYTLGGLPRGYELWERPRPLNPKHTDRWLYGHPSKKLFDSPFQFYPHWKFLLNYGSGESCKCRLCDSSSTIPRSRRPANKGPSSTSSSVAPRSRAPPPFQKGPVDEEGTPDVYGQLFTLLRNEETLKRRIEERASLDWRAEKPLVENFVCSIPSQASFLPRQGEVVFYLRPTSSPLELRQDLKSCYVPGYDPRTDSYKETPPQWLAGIVTQVPVSSPTVSSLYPPSASSTPISNTGPAQPSLNASGYRISPLPSVNSSNKLLSKQQTYVPLHLIRPFSLQTHLLAGIPRQLLHESVTNALTASATISLIDRHSFSGTWPHASIHSRGVFIGPEAYWLGDTVLLLPENPSRESITEIMHISDIVTAFHDLQPSDRDHMVTGNECERISIEIHGEVYTIDPARTKTRTPIPVKRPTPTTQAYGPWFHLDLPGDVWAAPFPRILSRLYERDALLAWLPATTTATATLTTPFPQLTTAERRRGEADGCRDG